MTDEHKFLQRMKPTSQHVGLYQNGKKEGFGLVNYHEPRLLLQLGYFTSNQLHGLGLQISGNGEKVSSYLGTFDYGVPNKFGQMAKNNGVYKGHIKEGQPFGRGLFTDSRGFQRLGTFTDGTMNGYAEITEELSAYKYCGLVAEDVPHGSGTETVGSETFRGYFCFGKRHGVGEMRLGKSVYKGTWKDGVKTGYGYEIQKDRFSYFGSFINGVKSGICEITYPDGTIYLGQISGCRKDGFGKQSLNDELYIGYWKNDKRHGIGFYRNPKGQTYFGQWREDQYKSQRGVELTEAKKSTSRIDQDSSSRLSQKPSELSYLIDDDEATPEFFDEATKRIIEMDEKLTGEKIKIDQMFSNLDTNFATDKRVMDAAKKEIELRCLNAQKEFDYMFDIFCVTCQKYGIDIFDAKQKIGKYPVTKLTEQKKELLSPVSIFKQQSSKNKSSSKKKQDASQLSDFKPPKISEVQLSGADEAGYFTLDKQEKSEAGVFEALLRDRKDSSHERMSRKQSYNLQHSQSMFKQDDSMHEIKGLILNDLTNKDTVKPSGKNEQKSGERDYFNDSFSNQPRESPPKKEAPFAKMIQNFNLPPPLARPQASVSVMSRVQESMRSDTSDLHSDNRPLNKSQMSALQSRRLEKQLAKSSQDDSARQSHTESTTFDKLSAKKRQIDSRLSEIDHALKFANK